MKTNRSPMRYLFYALVLSPPAIESAPAAVLLNEIMYNPSGDENITEFVELYNTGPDSVDLYYWRITDGSAMDTLQAYEDDGSMVLAPGGYAVVVDPGYREQQFAPYYIPDTALKLTITSTSLGERGLSNSTPETVTLIEIDGAIVSRRTYRTGAEDGHSEERFLVDGGEGNDNWFFSQEGQGTPGRYNSITPLNFDIAVDSLHVEVTDTLGWRGAFLEFTAWVSNVGLAASQGGTVHFFTTQYEYNVSDTSIAIVPLEPGEQMELSARSQTDEFGSYDYGVNVVIEDENSSNNTLIGTAALPFPAHAVNFSEIMADPPSDYTAEWVEFVCHDSLVYFNPEDWYFTDASGTAGRLALYPDDLDDSDYNTDIVVAANDSSLFEFLPINLNHSFLRIPTHWPSLNNDGDTLRLFDPSGKLIDWVVYGPALDGISFNRTTIADPPEVSDWTLSPSDHTNSLGYRNDEEFPGTGPIIGDFAIEVSPNPFSPNGDYHEDEVTFKVTSNEECELTIRLFDINGYRLVTFPEIRTKVNSVYSWDGMTGLQSPLPAGIYVWHAVIHGYSKSWQAKGTLVSAGTAR